MLPEKERETTLERENFAASSFVPSKFYFTKRSSLVSQLERKFPVVFSHATRAILLFDGDFSCALQLTDVRLNNAFNDFTMLANTQFVENVSSMRFRAKCVAF